MIALAIYLIGLAAYAIFSYVVLKVAYEAGHDGDFTMPVGAAYVLISAFFWIAAGILVLMLQSHA